MKIFMLAFVILLVSLPASAQEDENNRIRNAGKVMVEILNVPDDIPKEFTADTFAPWVLAVPYSNRKAERSSGPGRAPVSKATRVDRLNAALVTDVIPRQPPLFLKIVEQSVRFEPEPPHLGHF